MPGGVSDYTELVAGGLVAAGCVVHVWTRGDEPRPQETPDGVLVHRCARDFCHHGLMQLDSELQAIAQPRRLIIQYVPQAFGQRGLNYQFAAWVAQRGRRQHDDIQLMVHEAAFPFVTWPWHHNLIALANRWMLRELLSVSSVVYTSTPAWSNILKYYGPHGLQPEWLPIPANLPAELLGSAWTRPIPDDKERPVAIGHFGTFGGPVRRLLLETCRHLLARKESYRLILLGRGSHRFREELVGLYPATSQTIESADDVSSLELVQWMRQCDLAMQPYPDGISTRRTTAMAWLALGIPLVTNLGNLSEPIWSQLQPVEYVSGPEPEILATAVQRLWGNPERLADLREKSRAVYDAYFSLENTVRRLRGASVLHSTGSAGA